MTEERLLLLLLLLLLFSACLKAACSCLTSFLTYTALLGNEGGVGRAQVGPRVQGCRGVSQAQPCKSIWEAPVGGQAGQAVSDAEPAAQAVHERGRQAQLPAAVSTEAYHYIMPEEEGRFMGQRG